ncbi:1,2-dihydroxy-3-keto-5-methylthiopentene dioxygenase [Microsporum canis]|uniref:Striatin Pro11 n=1 Tax=Arthroderma otae (strain ATCC MYA-4605 / CBS 113480) TaxID=554155 RepID=C5FIQ6_ARTOC|nr:striatin Pro11 [Microsporum canis CBS 113480]EEQ29147.1 striatin Pro11 [Microsporum canis CBS 113480]
MAGNGGMGAGMDASNGGGQPQGTEYTLQGVMRFLQTEWHRHERDRNAWEIERAEMKSRIGRLEGDARTSKRMHESLGKHVRILEIALKKEREKTSKLAEGEKLEPGVDPKEVAKKSLKALEKKQPKPSSGFDINAEDEDSNAQHENEREKSRLYLGKCTQEVAYHVIPGSHPPPELNEQDLMNNDYQQHQLQRQPLESGYLQEHQRQQQQPVPQQQQPQKQQLAQTQPQLNHVNMVREPEGSQLMMPTYNENGAQGPTQREFLDRRSQEQQRANEATQEERNANYEFPSKPEEPSQGESKSTEAFSGKEDFGKPPTTNEIIVDEADGWNFDEAPSNEPTPAPVTRRPDTDAFPSANFIPPKSPTRGRGSRRKSSGGRRRSDGHTDVRELSGSAGPKADTTNFKVRFALRGHLDVVRSVIFTGGGSPSEPEICTCGDDGTIKRWIIPATYGVFGPNAAAPGSDLDVTSYFTHRGHNGSVTALAACPPSQNFSSGGRATGDGWVFSGGQDASVRVWERGRVDPKATLDGHKDAVWAICVLPGTSKSVFGDQCNANGGPDRVLLASGAADGRILIWAISTPPQLSSPQISSRRSAGGSRRANSISSGSNFPTSPQPSTASTTAFHYTLVHQIVRSDCAPTCISPLSLAGVNFVVSYADASIIVYDTRTGEEIVGMASLETYDGTRATGVNAVVASTIGFDGTANLDPNRALSEEESVVHGATGTSGGVEGVVISGYEDRYIRFFDANSGQCTYTMLAHPAAISSLSQSPDGRELVSAGHDASLRFWSLEKRSCTQEITSHRLMRGEGVCSVVWSQDGRWVASGGGDGVVKVFSR